MSQHEPIQYAFVHKARHVPRSPHARKRQRNSGRVVRPQCSPSGFKPDTTPDIRVFIRVIYPKYLGKHMAPLASGALGKLCTTHGTFVRDSSRCLHHTYNSVWFVDALEVPSFRNICIDRQPARSFQHGKVQVSVPLLLVCPVATCTTPMRTVFVHEATISTIIII
jgi:hypothetical protein